MTMCWCRFHSLADMFSFDLYDTDGSGELSAREVKKMLRDIYGGECDSNFHARK